MNLLICGVTAYVTGIIACFFWSTKRIKYEDLISRIFLPILWPLLLVFIILVTLELCAERLWIALCAFWQALKKGSE